ncbi:alpha/beta hydrolase [Aureimonas frigidaquae]|uniref:alpha/beta hydrolase n=1 Tax=Aureimonas frigidaquae TaxID=424757 RepID=UPI0007804259|nr:alpha/beta hydrolase [Aureimonas frigidaquae]
MAGHSIVIDRAMFDDALISDELAELNSSIISFQKTRPGPWDFPEEVVRQARREGKGVFPPYRADENARLIVLRGRDGHEIPARMIVPTGRPARGTYLHLHGGGWVFGEAIEHDGALRQLAEATGLVTLAIDYRLAPEHPFPAAPQDCEDVALALAAGAIDGAPTGFLAIGGESAGAHLAVLTLISLRDGHGMTPFRAANLNAGCYDLSLTPSVRNAGEERLVLNTDDVKEFVMRFVPEDRPLRDPAVSPLYADLSGLPPALFTIGTKDLLLDDTLFMASRWTAAGNIADLSVWTGACHVFQAFERKAGETSRREMARFLSRAADTALAATGEPR